MTPENTSTYFPPRSARKIKLESLDPGLALGLLIRNSSDLKSIENAFSNYGILSKIALMKDSKKEMMLASSIDSF